MPKRTLNINFDRVQLIVSSAIVTLGLSMTDYKSVIRNPFHGRINQQWIVKADDDGQIAIMSQYNKKYIVPDTRAVGSKLVTDDAAFWWIVDKNGDGYILSVPYSDLGLSLGDGTLCETSEATPLFFIENVDANLDDLERGRLPKTNDNGETEDEILSVNPDDEQSGGTSSEAAPEKEGSDPPPKPDDSAVPTNEPDGSPTGQDPIAQPQSGTDTEDTKTSKRNTDVDQDPDPSLKPSSIFGISRPKKVVYSQSLLVPPSSKGKADIAGFGMDGVVIWRQNSQVQNKLVTRNFGYTDIAGKWRVDQHIRLFADTTGNGRADIIGFSDGGVLISVDKGDDVFQEPKLVLPEFGCDAGWDVTKHLRFVADLRNTGRADIIGFKDDGVYLSLNNGDGTFSPPKLVVQDFGYEAGNWKLDTSLRFLADLNGNGLLDIIGFGRVVWASFNNGDGTFQPLKPVLPDLSNGQGWYNDRHPRFVADLTGDGRPDLIGIKDDGVYVAFNRGDGTFEPAKKIIDNEFSYNKGWRVEKHPRLIADLTGDGRGDIVGFFDDGVYVAINNGDKTFKPVKRVIDKFSWNENWRIEKHPRLLADLTGDGRADIVAIGATDVYVSYNNGAGNFGPQTKLVENFGDQRPEWATEKTVKYVVNLYS